MRQRRFEESFANDSVGQAFLLPHSSAAARIAEDDHNPLFPFTVKAHLVAKYGMWWVVGQFCTPCDEDKPMDASKLDQVQNISPNFNKTADVELEKTAAQYQLTKEEQQERFTLGTRLTELTKQEKANFSDPKEYQRRWDEKYAELAQKHNVPEPKLVPEGTVVTLTLEQLRKQTSAEVMLDHESRIQGYNTEYNKGLTAILNRARENGRGPRLSEEEQRRAAFMERRQQQRRQERDRDRER